MELSREALDVIAKVEKLMALANNNPNENEAAVAANKAAELLAAYNLDMAQIGRKEGERRDNRLKGGLYEWQRELWNACAEINFCLYRFYRGLQRGQSYEHRLIGSPANVAGAKAMAEYLQQTIERHAKDEQKHLGHKSPFVRELIAFREGMSDRLVRRLWQIKWDRQREDDRKKAAEEARAKHPGYASDSRALVLGDVIQNEQDLNEDHLYGLEPGTTARKRAEAVARRAAASAWAQRLLVERDARELADPSLKEARLAQEKANRERWEKEEARRERRRTGGTRTRKATAREERSMTSTYRTGYSKGGDVSLNKQVDRDQTKKIGQ